MLPLKSAKSREIAQKFELIASSSLTKVIGVAVNRKHTCNFLLVISINVGCIL